MYPFGKEQGDREITEHYVESKTCPRVAIKDGLYFFDDQFYEIFVSISKKFGRRILLTEIWKSWMRSLNVDVFKLHCQRRGMHNLT